MDSKAPFEDEPAPPSYDSLTTTSTSLPQSYSYSREIQAQLNTLTSQITSTRTQKSILNSIQDEKILSHLTSHIQTYLSSFASSGLRAGTLILVPAAGLENEHALPCDYDIRDPEEFDRLVRVSAKENRIDGDKWYWKDEEMAMRLAKCLNPKPTELPHRSVISSKAAESKAGSSVRSFWRRKSAVQHIDRPPPVEPRDAKVDTVATEDKVSMKVIAEEVTFRYENDMGIFETERGYGIVLKIEVTMAKH